MKVTLRQVAADTGLSVATVSRVATGKGYVSPEARALAEQSMTKLGYARKENARHGLRGSDDLVMILVGGIRSSISSEFVEALSAELHARGKFPFIAVTHFDSERELAYLQFAADNRFSGIIAMTITETPEMLSYLRGYPCPMTMVNRYLVSLDMDYLRTDYYRMGYEATEYLIAHGHREIAFIGGTEVSSITQDKQLGFEDSMQAHHLGIRPEFLIHCNRLIYANGSEVASRLLSLSPRPTAIVSSNDISVGILNELNARGMRVPEDMSIFTCEDSALAAHAHVPLTAMSIDVSRICADAVKTLLRRQRQPKTPRRLLIYTPRLVERASVAFYAG